MKFILNFTHTAKKVLKNLKENSGKKKQYKAVIKTFKFLTQNPKHPGLQTHIYYSLQGPNGEKIFEAYAERVLQQHIEFSSIMVRAKANLQFLQLFPILRH